MNNPGIDLVIWKQLKSKWAQWDESGRELKVEFKVIRASGNAKEPLAIDVIQTVNDAILVETVQHAIGEAYSVLGIAGFSMEELVQTYKKMLHELYRSFEKEDADLVVEMTPHLETSGETKGYLQQPRADSKTSVMLNYQHYYVLNAMREKMIELVGDRWNRVKAVYHAGGVEYYFGYEES